MICIRKAKLKDAETLADLARQTFLESHGHSAKEATILRYLDQNYTVDVFLKELNNIDFQYHVLEYENKVIGFSKIVLNQPHPLIFNSNITKLDRIYILENYLNRKLGWKLFDFNLSIAKTNGQKGMWLYTWVENRRAIDFYQKNGFKIIGSHDFAIDETHSNPNHLMYLQLHNSYNSFQILTRNGPET